jgi:hypothetical protein
MYTHSLLRFIIVAIAAWTVNAGMLERENSTTKNLTIPLIGLWHQRASGFRRSLGNQRIADTRHNLILRHASEVGGVGTGSPATLPPTGTGIFPPSGTGCPAPIIGAPRGKSRGNSVVPHGCPGPYPVSGSVTPSGTGTAVSAGTGLPTRVVNGTVASTGFSLPVGTGVTSSISLVGTAAPTTAPGNVRRGFELPYAV